MEYFSRGFKSVLGGQAESEDGPSGAETIERLCDRVSSATLLEDRRDAVRAIKSLSKKFRLEVGTGGMEVLCGVLQKDRTDSEICGLALEALVNVMTTDSTDEQSIQNEDLAVQFSEIFLKDEENVTNLLSLLEEYDFRVRWPTVRLLTSLLHNRLMQIQQCVLVSPLGVSRLMDLLSDSREVIRNDGLLLLIHLTKGNAAIQKIVAFENAFDRLLEVLAEEGYSDGGVVAEDCLTLIANLFNASNINFFREGSFIPRLVPYFDFSEYTTANRPWNEQKVKNVLLMLKLVRCLVSPSNPPQSTASSQKVIHSCNLLKLLCDILMTSGIPAEILTETVNTVAEIIRGNEINQGAFSVVNAPYNPPKPAIVVLLMSMISDKQPASLRCAVLYCFQSYLYKNPTGQSRIISTLLPSSADANTNNVTAGQLLCGGLFSADSFSNWCAATALSHALLGNKELKEQLLRVQLATGVGSQPVSLLQQCSNILSNGGSSAQTRVSVLSLLCHWLSSCPVAVSHLLSNGAIIPFLFACIEQPSETHETVIQGLSAILIGVCMVYNNNDVEAFTKESIKRVISTRFDPEHFLAKINDVSKTEEFITASKFTQIHDKDVKSILFDHEFTKMFKKLEGKIARTLFDDDDGDAEPVKDMAAETEYKETIKGQSEELVKLRDLCKELEASSNQAQRELEKKAIEFIQLRNQVAIMKDQTPAVDNSKVEHFTSQINSLHLQLKTKEEQILNLQNQLNNAQFSSVKIDTVNGNGEAAHMTEQTDAKVTRLNQVVVTLEEKNRELAEKLQKSQKSMGATQASLEVLTVNREREINESLVKNQQLAEMESLKVKLIALEQENVGLKVITSEQKIPAETNDMITRLQAELLLKENAYSQQRQDYEDLLVLLEDQDGKIKKFKNRLRELGEVVENESTDDDDDGDDDSSDDDDEEQQQLVDGVKSVVDSLIENIQIADSSSVSMENGPENGVHTNTDIVVDQDINNFKQTSGTNEIFNEVDLT